MKAKIIFFLFFVSISISNIAITSASEEIEEENPEIEYSNDLPNDVKARLIYQETEEIYFIGLQMPEMGTVDKVTAMHRYQLASDILRERAETLPLSYFYLRTAINSLRMCVSMSPSALEQCEMVKLNLDEAKPVVFPEQEEQAE